MPVHLTASDIGVSVLAPNGDGSALTGVGGLVADTGFPVPEGGDKTVVLPPYTAPDANGMSTVDVSAVAAAFAQIALLTSIVNAMRVSFQADKYPHS